MSVPYDPVAITSVTRVLQVATATVVSTAAMYTGMMVQHYGFDQDAYNGSFIITVVNATTYEFTVVGSPTTPATGSGFVRMASSPFIPLMGGPYEPPPTSYHSAVLEDDAQIKAGPGSLMSFYGNNTDAAGVWILLFDTASVPSSGDVCKEQVAAGAADNFFIDVPDGGTRYTVGIWAVASTTPQVLTKATGALIHFDAAFHD